MVKKLLGILLALSIIVTAIPSTVYAAEPSDGNALSDTSSMDALDILIATYRVLAATAADKDSAWDKITEITSLEPLYNLDGEVVAFYLTFEPAGYVIVNNNLLNPVIMEYSPEKYPEMDHLVLKISSKDENGDALDFICYGGALNCFTYNDAIEYINQSESNSYYLGAADLYVNNDNADTFSAIHAYIGNGPVLFPKYNSGLEDYVNDRGYTYHYFIGGNYLAIKNGIDSNHMSTVLLCGSLLNYHMVNAVGYREYASGTNYIRIVDGWESTSQRFIISTNIMGSYTTWIS